MISRPVAHAKVFIRNAFRSCSIASLVTAICTPSCARYLGAEFRSDCGMAVGFLEHLPHHSAPSTRPPSLPRSLCLRATNHATASSAHVLAISEATLHDSRWTHRAPESRRSEILTTCGPAVQIQVSVLPATLLACGSHSAKGRGSQSVRTTAAL